MSLTAQKMLEAFACLDKKLPRKVRLIMGGGGAMLLAYHYALSTSDIDAIPAKGITIQELDPLVKQVAEELSLPGDWLNPYYSSFAHVLPTDYGDRLIDVFSAQHLTVSALSKEDLLIMKCFAARQKDVVHARVLIKKGADLTLVKNQIRHLANNRIPGSEKAERFLAELIAFFSSQDDEV